MRGAFVGGHVAYLVEADPAGVSSRSQGGNRTALGSVGADEVRAHDVADADR